VGYADTKTKRLFRLIHLLKLRPRTTAELAQILGVEQRTVQRYLKDLDELAEELNLRLEPEGNGYVLRGRSSSLNPYDLLFDFVAHRFFFHQAPSRHRYFVERLERLVEDLPEHIRHLASLELDFYKSHVHKSDRVVEYVFRAWQERRVLEVDYRDAKGQTKRRSLEIWFVEINRWNLGMYALARIRDKGYAFPSLFKLARMSNPRLLEDQYEIPRDFNPRSYLESAWGIAIRTPGVQQVQVRLRFDPSVAWRLEEEDLPKPQESFYREDGSLEVVYLVNTDAQGFPFEILGWVLSWGSLVEVLEPESLRKRWAEEVLRLAGRLGQGTGDPPSPGSAPAPSG